MKPDFSVYNLELAIGDAAQSAFSAAIAEHPDHAFFAFALTTLSSVQYIECSANSEQNLKTILKQAGASGAGQDPYYKWFPNEWGDFEYLGQESHDFFRPVKTLLARINEETVADALATFGLREYPLYTHQPHYNDFAEMFEAKRNYVFRSMSAALKNLDVAGCFGDGEARRGRIIFADVYDDSFSEELRASSADQINTGRASPELIQEFLRAE